MDIYIDGRIDHWPVCATHELCIHDHPLAKNVNHKNKKSSLTSSCRQCSSNTSRMYHDPVEIMPKHYMLGICNQAKSIATEYCVADAAAPRKHWIVDNNWQVIQSSSKLRIAVWQSREHA